MKNRDGRPEWFKFWRRNCQQLDIEELSLEDRGIVFTNIMRYFTGDETIMIPMSPLQRMAFNVMKISVDDAVSSYQDRAETNRQNGLKGGRPPKPKESEETNSVFEKPKKAKKPEDRSKKIEVRSIEGQNSNDTADRPFEGPSADEELSHWMGDLFHE